MIVTDETRDARRDTSTANLTPDELRTLARRERHESGGRQTGKHLAAMFGTSAQWRQDQAAAGCAEAAERGTPAVAAVALVAAGAAAASCSHMHAVALEPGEGAMARALPLSVGGLVAAWPPVALASSIGLLLRQTRGER